MSRIVTAQEFTERLEDCGANAECECGSREIKTYSVGGEMEPLFLLNKDQLVEQTRPETGAVLAGRTLFAMSCNQCGLVRFHDPSALGLVDDEEEDVGA
jgi:hypothetical protein